MAKLHALLGILLFVMLLVGCGNTTPNNVAVIEQSLNVATITWKSMDASFVHSFYQHSLNLPKATEPSICPKQVPNTSLELIFAHDQQRVLDVTSDDCGGYFVGGRNDDRLPDAQFESMLQQIEQQPPVSCTPYPPTAIYPGNGGCP